MSEHLGVTGPDDDWAVWESGKVQGTSKERQFLIYLLQLAQKDGGGDSMALEPMTAEEIGYRLGRIREAVVARLNRLKGEAS